MSFIHNFIAQNDSFGRALATEERELFVSFTNAKIDNMTFLGIGSIRPSNITCSDYTCLTPRSIHLYTTSKFYVGTLTPDTPEAMGSAWDICHNSTSYKCVYRGVFGATYNCLGWALGISKWLNPSKVTNYVKAGLTKEMAIKEFLGRISELYPSTNSINFATIVDKLAPLTNFKLNSIPNNTVAFYFNNTECLHGSRFLQDFNSVNL